MGKIFAAFSLAMVVCLSNVAVAIEEGPTTEDVTFVQGLLLRLGYDPGPIDGICGDQMVSAVRSFHEAFDLPLKPGHIEPQAPTVVRNLTTVFATYIMQPQTSAPEVYRQALEGDADAALTIGTMYHRGGSAVTDQMLAYAWWSVAEINGNKMASRFKDNLAASGEISDHEMSFAAALAGQIDAERARKNTSVPVAESGLARPEPTM